MRALRAAAIAITAIAITACTTTAAPAPPGSYTTTTPTAAAIAQCLGATGLRPIAPPTLYALSEVVGTWHSHPVDIATFSTDILRDHWIATRVYILRITRGHLYAVVTSD